MERLDTDIGSVDAAVQETPEVLKAISVNLSVNVFLSMVGNFVGIILSQPIIGVQGIEVEGRASFDMLLNASVKGRCASGLRQP